VKPLADGNTLEAIIANRYEVMAKYAAEMREAVGAELDRLKAQGAENTARWANCGWRKPLAAPRRRQDSQGVKPTAWRARCRDSPKLAKLVAMREELRQLWTRSRACRPTSWWQDLQAWCRKAEDSGIAMLQEFSLKLRAAHA
jgi:stearoyl-CoA desaturase (Delta-9 desaturase)